MTLTCIPIIGGIIYLIFGRGDMKTIPTIFVNYNKEISATNAPITLTDTNELMQNKRLSEINFVNRISENATLTKNVISVISNGNKFFLQLFKDIEAATSYIFMNFFIIKDGILFRTLIDLLLEKAETGVKIIIIYDHFSS
jgi:cardiolipin synthase